MNAPTRSRVGFIEPTAAYLIVDSNLLMTMRRIHPTGPGTAVQATRTPDLDRCGQESWYRLAR